MKRVLSRRDFLKATGAGLAGTTLLGIAGCGGGGDSDSVSLRYSTFLGDQNYQDVQAMLADYEDNHPGVEIAPENVPGSGAALYPDRLRTAMSAGEAPDIFRMWGGELAGPFIDSQQVLNLDQYYEEQNWEEILVPSAVEQTERNGSRWGVPVAARGIGIWYREDIFEEYELTAPESYQELEDICQTLVTEGITPMSVGGQYGWHTMRVLQYFLEMTAGPQLHDRLLALEETWDRPEVAEAFELLQKWVDEEWFPSGFLSISPEDAQLPWFQGDAAMMPEGDAMVAIIEGRDLELSDYNFFVPPTGREPLRISGYIEQLMIAESSANQDAAVDLLNWIVQPEVQREHFIAGSTATSEAFPSEEEAPLTSRWGEVVESRQSYLIMDQAFDNELANSYFTAQDNVVSGQLTPEQGASNVQQAIEEIVGE